MLRMLVLSGAGAYVQSVGTGERSCRFSICRARSGGASFAAARAIATCVGGAQATARPGRSITAAAQAAPAMPRWMESTPPL